MNRNLTLAVVSLLGLVVLPCAAAEEREIQPLLEIREKIQKQQSEGVLDIGSSSIEFKAAILATDFSPSDDLTTKLAALQEGCATLLEALGQRKASATPTEEERVAETTKALFRKLDEIIEADYKFQMGLANVSPPQGVPNAASGMDPNAISDPKLREQYLEGFAREKRKRNKNTQQLELRRTRQILILHVTSLVSSSSADGLKKNKMVERFTDDGESRRLLTKFVAPAGK